MSLWQSFIYFALGAVLCWAAGAGFAWKGKKSLAVGLTAAGLAVFLAYILSMWFTLERPPLRTMGETRLWYALFLPLAGLLVYLRYGYRWILSFSTVLATVFVCVNLFKPEIHDKTLMPALQSPWFAPHVIVYMFAYALLGAATLMALYALLSRRADQDAMQRSTDELVAVGWAFLTFGMLFGALWAKEAWGHYWTWDPKETWAAVTWLGYLVHIHWRGQSRLRYCWLLLCFVLLQMCWWGINYLPAAQGASVHTYG
ncbi:MAG: cytochrome c biogenesis protein CcsA [Alloprevotella sp.]|nr:cytochrome c biogenesis protein CcsA [Alloprevotella sp.]MBR1653184.1 cytochrome c biogenesis protein CcsA [Alloprevotella sp.]